LLFIGRALEFANYYLIYRWRQNIKRDIIEAIQIKLPRETPTGIDNTAGDHLDTSILLDPHDTEGCFSERHSMMDHESAPLLQQYQYFRNKSTKMGSENSYDEEHR